MLDLWRYLIPVRVRVGCARFPPSRPLGGRAPHAARGVCLSRRAWGMRFRATGARASARPIAADPLGDAGDGAASATCMAASVLGKVMGELGGGGGHQGWELPRGSSSCPANELRVVHRLLWDEISEHLPPAERDEVGCASDRV